MEETQTPQEGTELPILIIEDNEIDVEITKRILKRSGVNVRVLVARDGEEAIDVLFGEERAPLAQQRDRERPRLIVLDLGLPGMDGRELLERIKKDPVLCPIPVAILTGFTEQRRMLDCMAIGGNMYFVKPMTVTDAINIIGAVRKYWMLLERL
jgi:two-component system response regulator